MSTTVDLTGQVAIVTGGGGGLGRAFAVALASAGAAVAVMGRNLAPLMETVAIIESGGGRALPVSGDVAAPTEVASVLRTTESSLGPVDILVNNAGVTGPLGCDWDVDPDDWWRTFEINMRGPFLCARAVLAGMVDRRRGRIVNISSNDAGSHLAEMTAFSAAKAALTRWTEGLASELRNLGVSVFALAPGFPRTPMTERLATSVGVPQPTGDFFRAVMDAGRDTPIARSVDLLLYLVSGRADRLSGGCYLVNHEEAVLGPFRREMKLN